MLRFFRNIRFKLAAENKVAKYMQYAIGEIVLLVIGILIALQVNNWNELRKERNQEKRFLVRLEADLNTDLQNISNSISANKDRLKRAEFIMAVAEQPKLAEDSATYFIFSIERAGYTNSPVISDHTFEEIKSSGKLSLIRNEKLRTALQKYYSWTLNRAQYDFIRQDIQLDYLHKRMGILTSRQHIDMGSFEKSEHYSSDEAKLTYQRMTNKPDFLEMMPLVIQNKIRSSEEFDSMHRQAAELKTMINKELNNQKSN